MSHQIINSVLVLVVLVSLTHAAIRTDIISRVPVIIYSFRALLIPSKPKSMVDILTQHHP